MKKPLLVSISILIILFSCNKRDPGGKWDDNIKLSQKTATFQSSSDSITITTQFDGWWVNGIFIDSSLVQNPSNVNTSLKNFVFISPEFKLERINGTIIKIKMNPNLTSSDRQLKIGLQDGNYFDGIVISQGH